MGEGIDSYLNNANLITSFRVKSWSVLPCLPMRCALSERIKQDLNLQPLA